MNARECYNKLTSGRSQFLRTAVECSELTLPYLISDDLSTHPNHKKLLTPWQSIGAKAVVTLAAKLMLALLPPQTTFFKLQVRDDKLGEELPPEIRSELDLSFSKMERMVMEYIAASSDRVVVHQALKHLIVSGNTLVFMGKDGLKNFPLNRYVVNRDGNGNVLEIVTKELINRKVLGFELPEPQPKAVNNEGLGSDGDDVEVYTSTSSPSELLLSSTTELGWCAGSSTPNTFLLINSFVTISNTLPLPSRLTTNLFNGKFFKPSLPININELPPTIRCFNA